MSYDSNMGAIQAREAALRLMTDPDIRSFIGEHEIVRATWRELKKRRDAVQGKPWAPSREARNPNLEIRNTHE